jgi:hypothetical protein
MFPFCCESLDIGYVYAHLLREWAAEQYERFSLQLHVVAGMRTQQLALNCESADDDIMGPSK